MNIKKILLIIPIMTFYMANALFAVPQMINLQGRLTDQNGVNKEDGTYNIKFSIWDNGPGQVGEEKWTETHQTVNVNNDLPPKKWTQRRV